MMIVIGLTATSFTIAPPDDPYCLDIAGFEPNLFDTLVNFIKTDGGVNILNSLDPVTAKKLGDQHLQDRELYCKKNVKSTDNDNETQYNPNIVNDGPYIPFVRPLLVPIRGWI